MVGWYGVVEIFNKGRREGVKVKKLDSYSGPNYIFIDEIINKYEFNNYKHSLSRPSIRGMVDSLSSLKSRVRCLLFSKYSRQLLI